jgi:excinuclease ABC subunit B
MFGDEIERLTEFDPFTGEVLADHQQLSVFPAKQFITAEELLKQALHDIEKELEELKSYYAMVSKY